MGKVFAPGPPPAALSVEMRLAMVEQAVRDLTATIAGLKALRDGRCKLPTMPEGSGLALAVARQRARWSGKDFAAALGVSKSQLSLWETERMSIPRWRAEGIRAIFAEANEQPPEWSDDAGEA